MTQTNQATTTLELTTEQLDAIHGGEGNQTVGQVLTQLGETIVKALVSTATTALKAI